MKNGECKISKRTIPETYKLIMCCAELGCDAPGRAFWLLDMLEIVSINIMTCEVIRLHS